MKLFFSVFLFILLTVQDLRGQKNLSASEFNDDLLQLSENLKKYYSGLYYYESSDEFEHRLQESFLKEPDSISILDAYHKIANFIAGNKDLHLSAGLPKNYFDKDTPVFPLILRKFDDEFFVAYNQSADTTLKRGDKILFQNHQTPIDDFEKFKTLYGTDNNNPYSKEYYASTRFAGYYSRWYGLTDSLQVVSVKNRYSPIDTTVILFPNSKAVTDTLKSRYPNALRKNFKYTLIDSSAHLAHLDITSFVGSRKFLSFNDLKFKKELKNAFHKINNDEIDNLILDLRGNGGGNVINVKRLINYLNNQPFSLYDTISVSKRNLAKTFKPWLVLPYLGSRLYFNKKDGNYFYKSQVNKTSGYKKKLKNRYSDNLFVLMDGGSYSATTFTISLLNNQNRATFVGTQPGGADWGSFAGTFYSLKLKNSKMLIRIPLMKLMHSTQGKAAEDFFVQPDYYVGQSFEDFLNRKDSLIEFVKELVK